MHVVSLQSQVQVYHYIQKLEQETNRTPQLDVQVLDF